MMLIKLSLGNNNSSVKVVVGQGRIQNLVALVIDVGRFNAALCRLPAVEEENEH
jgi:hypothetical protein